MASLDLVRAKIETEDIPPRKDYVVLREMIKEGKTFALIDYSIDNVRYFLSRIWKIFQEIILRRLFHRRVRQISWNWLKSIWRMMWLCQIYCWVDFRGHRVVSGRITINSLIRIWKICWVLFQKWRWYSWIAKWIKTSLSCCLTLLLTFHLEGRPVTCLRYDYCKFYKGWFHNKGIYKRWAIPW